jgi:hypothetical protein
MKVNGILLLLVGFTVGNARLFWMENVEVAEAMRV